ncbi:hypothetical protein RESH_04075 [Rhodopirellula europaea SH398]|uniref:Uncharacterized protein n=1 Tax=Rhodopirellula europaea SH398 TaxID=1263868 RepID=M5S1D2_9BACT|nr:hypothetical protein RESH_04075 [Rhodopirellula europaea SH398]
MGTSIGSLSRYQIPPPDRNRTRDTEPSEIPTFARRTSPGHSKPTPPASSEPVQFSDTAFWQTSKWRTSPESKFGRGRATPLRRTRGRGPGMGTGEYYRPPEAPTAQKTSNFFRHRPLFRVSQIYTKDSPQLAADCSCQHV